jgi:hypothetical protein
LLKNGHLLRCPHPSSLRSTAKVHLTPQEFGSSRERDFARLNLHLALFEQPAKHHSFNS